MLEHVEFTVRFAQISGPCLQIDDRFADAETSWKTSKTANFLSLYFPKGFTCFIFRFFFAIRANILKRRFFYER